MDSNINNVAAVIGSPAQWGILAFVIVVVFAPQLLPVLARLLGAALGTEVCRRLGLPVAAPRAKPARRPVEVLPPERAQPTLRASDERSLASKPEPRSPISVLPVVAVVASAAAVLLWYLLHTR